MTHNYPDLEPCESVVAPSDELLYRQITQHKWNEVARIPSSAAFGPADADDGKPSFARGTAPGVDAQSSRDWHQKNARSSSIGVWAVTSSEVDAATLRVVDDSNCPLPAQGPRAPGHCFPDYRSLQKAAERNARKELLLRAIDRGELPTTDCLAEDSE